MMHNSQLDKGAAEIKRLTRELNLLRELYGASERECERLQTLMNDCYRIAIDRDNYGPHGWSRQEATDRLAEIAELCRALKS